MNKKIDFWATSKMMYDIAPKPEPASKYIPEWWKDADPYVRGPKNLDGKTLVVEENNSNASFKKCRPMLDTLTFGYMLPLWSDVLVTNNNGQISIDWRVSYPVFEDHNGQEVEVPDGYSKTLQLKYRNPWVPKLPKGYSLLVIPPAGYPNPVFKPIFGIIDYDNSKHPLLPPVFVKEGFSGIVEKGTPIAQIVPFKRDNWQSSFNYYDQEEFFAILNKESLSTIANNYVKNIWTNKSFK
jgi:hypothetical protein